MTLVRKRNSSSQHTSKYGRTSLGVTNCRSSIVSARGRRTGACPCSGRLLSRRSYGRTGSEDCRHGSSRGGLRSRVGDRGGADALKRWAGAGGGVEAAAIDFAGIGLEDTVGRGQCMSDYGGKE